MCKQKACGGMGFRNLQAFNKAMLAKQLWRIVQNPQSHVARVLKSRYFPTGDILNAKLGNSPSYSWRSIHSSLEVIRKGTRWRVGNRKLIHIWDDKWLPTPFTYKPISPPNNTPQFPMVSSLIDPMTKWWRVNLVRATFLPFEADTILKIPLSHDLPEDKINWLGNCRGVFTVKSAYHIALNLLNSMSLWSENPLSTHGIKKSFLDSIPYILSHATLQDLELFFAIAWAVWFNRNRLVHEGNGLPPMQDFNQARAPPSIWTLPPPRVHKINVDGASSESDCSSSIGVVIRDSLGQVVAALCKPLQACFPTELTEIMAVEQGVLLAQELQLPWVIVESDSSNVIQAIQEKATGSSYGHIIQRILQSCESFESCFFKHLSRNFNSVAHELAQHARRSGSHCLWKGVTPPVVATFLQSDLL
ncbi:uncharacterized protein LOC111984763 [Quercus suber]|uniref:uncharacterized protein LOC111984763 n=1 Tax=Quercus suber TaxID=58331 RepID=UPI000CE24BDD|nr:uncharacterized protein LOC111984763 [Quercus suber]